MQLWLVIYDYPNPWDTPALFELGFGSLPDGVAELDGGSDRTGALFLTS